MENRYSLEKIMELARQVFKEDPEKASEIAKDAYNIIIEAYKRNPAFISPRKSKSVLASLFYILSHKHGVPKTQNQIIVAMNTNQYTLYYTIRGWLQNFPQLFKGIEKFRAVSSSKAQQHPH
jgi:transcription initiation factor TFIIIB Brf1 subunit/transcription initiation factor TFIIB